MKSVSQFSLKKLVGTAAFLVSTSLVSAQAFAQGAAVVCEGYKPKPTEIVGQRAGKKAQKAFEAYSDELVDEKLRVKNAIDILLEVEAEGFDKAYVDNFVGQLYASFDQTKALQYIKRAADANVLNDGEQASALRTTADLLMMDKQYKEAIGAYKKWVAFTCKENADVYLRMAQAYYESGDLAGILDPAEKAIKINKSAGKLDKNPYLLKLTSYYERKLYPQTVGVAEELVRIFPNEKQWWVQLGQFYFLVEDFDKALSTLEIAYNQGYLEKPQQVKILAQLYAQKDIPFKAATLLEKHTKSGFIKLDESLMASIANSFHQAREYKKAAFYYGKAAQVSGSSEHYRKQGTLLLAAEDYKGALDALEKSLKDTDKAGRVHMAMMEANFYQGNFKEAHKHVVEAQKDKNTARSARSWEPYIKEKAKNRGIRI